MNPAERRQPDDVGPAVESECRPVGKSAVITHCGGRARLRLATAMRRTVVRSLHQQMAFQSVSRRAAISRQARWCVLLFLILELGCGVIPEGVSQDDPRLKPMFEAMARVDRAAMGFTPIARRADIRLERRRGGPYDAMLHVYEKTSRTIAFRRTADGYEWIGEQETFEGPREYTSVDGTFKEAITITYDRVPISGFPINTVAIIYRGEEPELASPRLLSLNVVRPWLKKWGYD